MDVGLERRQVERERVEGACPVCRVGSLEPFVSIPAVPVHVGALWPSAAAARGCPRGDLTLGHCAECGFIHNLAFDPGRADYDEPYDNALHFSAVFGEYERDLADHLIARYDLRGRHVLEIGCGSGHFLGLLCERGGNTGLGFDPSHDPAYADPLIAGRARVVPEYFSAAHAGHPADLICSRHVLEHVPRPDLFVRSLREGIADRDTPVYIEVPNGLLAFGRLSVGDLIYEHCSYFVASSLERLMTAGGFEVTDLREVYDGQFLAVEARPGDGAAPTGPATAAAECDAFRVRMDARLDEWRRVIDRLRGEGARVVAWGAGAKAVGLFNQLDLGEEVTRVVDLNPRKQGTFLAGTGQAIVPPADLTREPADAVLVMNPLYADEIGAAVTALGLDAQIVTVS